MINVCLFTCGNTSVDLLDKAIAHELEQNHACARIKNLVDSSTISTVLNANLRLVDHALFLVESVILERRK
jgi:hypothetical protein